MADNNLTFGEDLLPDENQDKTLLTGEDNNQEQIPPTNGEQDPPVKKQQSPKKEVAFNIFNTPVPKDPNITPKPNGVLDNIGQFIPNRVVGGAERNLGIDLDEYAPYFSNNMGYVGKTEGIDKSRALNQSNIAQFRNAVGRIGLNIIPEIVGQAANVLDIEDYFNSNQEVGNWLSNITKSVQENTNEALPIYRENPNKPLDVGDAAYWFDNGSSLVTSAGAFVALGYATGGASLSALTKGAKALQWLKTGAQAAELGAEASNAVRGASTLASSIMLNQAESIGIGVNVYEQAYNNKLTELQGNPEFATSSPAELQAIAKQEAATKASEAINYNKINILLNLTGANLLLKSPINSTRKLFNAPSLTKTASTIGMEGLQEGVEENINDISEQAALADKYTLKDGIERVLSDEGLESGLLGFIGGAGQVALGKVGKRLPVYDNTAYRNEYINRLESLKKDTTLSEEQKDAEAKKYALEKIGISSNKISDVQRQSQRYIRQQWELSNQNNLTNADKLTDTIAALNSAEESIALQKEIEKAKTEGNTLKAENLSNRLVNQQAFNAFETGTTENLENIYKGVRELSHEEAEERGIYQEGDEKTEDYYKTKMDKALQDVLALEKSYNESKKYINSSEIYNIKSNQYEIQKSLVNLDKKIAENKLKSSEFFNETDSALIATLAPDNITDINVINSPVNGTDFYKELKGLYKARKEYEDLNTLLQQTYNSVTSKDYQIKLNDNIKKMQESNRKKENKKIFKKKVSEERKGSNSIVNTLANTQTVVDEVDTSEVNTAPEILPDNKTTEEQEVIKENITPNEPTRTNTKQIENITASLPSTNNPMLDSKLSQFNDTFTNPNISLEEKNKAVDLAINTFNNPSFGTFFPTVSPDQIQNLIASAETIKGQINNQLKQTSEVNAALATQQENLISELEATNSPDTEEENLPDGTEDSVENQEDLLNRAQRLSNAMIEILRLIQKTGIDFNNFKEVVKSFETNVGKTRIQDMYYPLRNLYNVATNQNIESTYEELMYDNTAKTKIVKDSKDIQTFSVSDDVYTTNHDKVTKSNLKMLNDLANLNNLDARDSGFEFDSLNFRNEIGSNKLAYLARDYNTVFVPTTTENGSTYIAVTKGDIDNLIKSNLSDKVLDGSIKRGTVIHFIPLDSVQLEDGTVLNQSNTGIENAPIGVYIDGQLIDGLYLHDVNWINFTKLNNTKEGLEKDQETLLAIRKYILDKGTVSTTIDIVGPGVPIIDSSGEYNTISVNMPEVQIGIIKNGRVQLDQDNSVAVVNKQLPKEGANVAVITLGDGTKSALHLSRTRLSNEYKDSIIRAVDAYITQVPNEYTKTLKAEYEIDILKSEGIEKYLTKFIYGYNKSLPTVEDFNDFLNNIKDDIQLTQFKTGEIRFGTGQGINTGVITKQKDILEEDKKAILDSFRHHIDSLYTNIDINLKNQKFDLPIINEDGTITNEYENYTDYIKDNLLTKNLSIKLDNGKTIYTIQSSIVYNTGFLAQKEGSLFDVLDINKWDNVTTVSNVVKNSKPSSFNIGENSFEEITEAFDSPDTLDLFGGELDDDRTKLNRLEYDLSNLEQRKALILEYSPELTIVNNLPKISIESAEKETGTKVGTKGDINLNLISKTGISVEAASEKLYQDYFQDISSIDEQSIRDIIIDILKTGKNNFIDSITKESEIKNLKSEIRILRGNSRTKTIIPRVNRDVLKEAKESIKEKIVSISNLDTIMTNSIISNENIAKNLKANSTLIPKVSITNQVNLVKAIVAEVYQDLITKSNYDENYKVNIDSAIDLKLTGLEAVRQRYIANNHVQAQNISEQIDSIVENKQLLKLQVQRRLAKFANISSIDSVVNNEDVNEDETNDFDSDDLLGERNIYLDTALYSVNPQTQLRIEIQKLLSDVVDYKVDFVDGQAVFKERKNQFFDNIYVGESEVYKTIMNILATNNTSYIYPTYENYIAALNERILEKPFLYDVIEKLEYEPEHIKNAFVTGFSKHATAHIFLQQSYDKVSKKYSLKPIASNSRNLPDLVITEWQNKMRTEGIIKADGRNIVFNDKAIQHFNDRFSGIVNKTIPLNQENLNAMFSAIGIELPPLLYQNFVDKGIARKSSTLSLYNSFTQSGGLIKIIHTRLNRLANIKIDLEGKKDIDLDSINLFSDQAFKDLAYYIARYRNDLFSNSHKDGNGNNIYSFSNNKYFVDRFGELKTDEQLIDNLLEDPFSKSSTWLNGMINIDEYGNNTINKESLAYRYFQYNTLDSYKFGKEKSRMIDSLNEAEFEKMKLAYFYNQGVKANKYTPVYRFLFPTMSDKSTVFMLQTVGKNYELVDNSLSDSDLELLTEQLLYPEVQRIKQFEANPDKVNIKEYKLGANQFMLFPLLNEIEELWIIDEDGNKALHPNVGVTQDMKNILKQQIRNYINSEITNKYNKWLDYGIIAKDKKSEDLSLAYVDSNYSEVYGNPGFNYVLRNYVINNMVAEMNMQQLFIGDPALYTKNGKNNYAKAYNTNDNQLKRLAADNAGKTNIIADKDERFNLLIVKDKEIDNQSIGINYLKSLGEDIAEDYLEINGTDAQEYTTLEEHLKVMFKQGEISKEDMDDIMYKYITDKPLNLKDRKLILSANKPVYANNYKRDGVMSRLYVKSSSIPLLKQFTANSPLDKLREFMEDKKVDRVAFESAVKVGLPTKVISIFNIGEVVIPENWQDSLLQVPRYGHGIQNKVPYEPKKDKINYGSQRAKSLFTDLHEVDGFIDPITGKTVKGKELNKNYKNTWGKLYKEKYNKLINELEFNKVTGTINVSKLQSILTKEAVDRNYNINDLAGLELNETGDDFLVPLYLNNNESKINSLLNSIVDNRIRKIKVKGKSFVLVSEEGHEKTKVVSQDEVNLDKIILSKDWNGKLNTTVEEDGKISYAEVIVPFKFWDNKGELLSIKDFVDDKGFIDFNKISPELMELYGFRIPTQGLSSMSMIKVVGFLPEGFGDMIIASRDFVKQMGSDFDVDKLYTQMYNTYQDYKGNLSPIKNKSKEQYQGVKDLNEKILENEILDYTKAVFNNPSKEVQRKRAKALSFGNLKSIGTKLFVNPFNRYWTPLSEDFQSYRYMSARAGKALVGAFSSDSVFNSSLQEITKPVNFMYKNEEGVLKPYRIGIAGIWSNNLNQYKTADGRQYKSDTISAFQSAALDDTKEQLLYKLNINNYTSDAIRAMAQLGFDEEMISRVINQPSVKDYTRRLSLGERDIEIVDFNESQQQLILKTPIADMEKAIKDNIQSGDYQDAILSAFRDLTKKGKKLKSIQSIINSDSKGVGKNMFYTLAKVEKLVGLGKQNAISNIDQLIGDYLYYTDSDEYKDLSTEERKEWLEGIQEEGYYLYNNVLIKPTTINGYASVYATLFNSEIWNNYFPYNYTGIKDIIDNVVKSQVQAPITISQKAEEMQKVYSEYKSYLASSAYYLNNSNSVTDIRRNLLLDTATHMSLGSIVSDIKEKNKIINPFIDRLKVGGSNTLIDVSGKIPTEITMINASSLEMEEEVIINSIVSLLTNPVSLGTYNGQEYNTTQLMKDLIQYSLITKGIQTTNEFIKYIPVSYLKDIGYFAEIERQIFNREEAFGTAYNRFYTQYVQHNPDKYYNPLLEEFIDREEGGQLILKNTIDLLEGENQLPSVIVTPFPNAKGYRVYKISDLDGAFGYYEVDVLGDGIINEYNTEAGYAGSSLIYVNQGKENALVTQGIVENTKYIPETETEYIPKTVEETKQFLNLNRDTTEDNSPITVISNNPTLAEVYSLNDVTSSNEEKYKQILERIVLYSDNNIQSYFANKLLNITEYLANVPIYEDNTLNSKGTAFTTNNEGAPVQIRINSKKVNNEQELQSVLLEEIIHATLKSELLKDNDNTKQIKKLYNEVRQEAISKYGETIFKDVDNKLQSKQPLKIGLERDIVYNLSNVDEFVAAAITNKKFQEFLNNTKNNDKSLWQKIVDLVKDVLVKLGVIQDSQLEAVLANILSTIDSIDTSLENNVTAPRYVRTQGYLNTKFNLVGSDGNSIVKENAQEITDFINSNISNIYATNINGKVILGYNIYNNLNVNNSPDTDVNDIKGGNFKVYLDTINFRLEKLKNSLNKAKQDEDYTKIASLEHDIQEEKDKLNSVKEITSLVDLGYQGQQELNKVAEILNKNMSAEDILYVRSTVNFWRNAKEFIFDEFQLQSDSLGKQYEALERQAYTQHLKLVKIEKKYLDDYVKNKTGKDINIQDLFDDSKDVNAVESLTLDISEFDNALLSSIFIDVKEANVKAEEEAAVIAKRLDDSIEAALPELKALNSKDPWDIFRQKTKSGKLTGHLINQFSSLFYREKGARINALNNDSNFNNYENYVKWLEHNTLRVKLDDYFSENDIEITEEMKTNRDKLKEQLGDYLFNNYIKNQENKINQYRNAREGVINSLLDKFGLSTVEELNNNRDASNIYTNWVLKSSPFKMSSYIREGLPTYLMTYKGFNSQKFYEVVPLKGDEAGNSLGYYDNNFSSIENNPNILNFYNEVINTLKELKFYIPHDQQKTLAYNGLPEIEKTLIEQYTERGLKIGYKPILEALQKSVQSNYSDYAIGTPDPITQQPQKNMRIGMINNNYQDIKKYVALKTAQYIADNKKHPSLNETNAWEEEKINELAENKSFDLAKVLKVFSVGVLGYKHKSRIEDKIKLAVNIVDTMQEAQRRGDGTPLTVADTGRIYRKNAEESFTNIKSALQHFIDLNLYNDSKEEEGKGSKILTAKEKDIQNEINSIIKNYETELEELESTKEAIGEDEYLKRKSLADEQLVVLKNDLKDLGTNRVYSKYADNVLKYFQVLGMGWNVLGGISNMGFGLISNIIEGAGNQLYSNTDLAQAYKLVSASMLKNVTFNKVEIGEAKKIRRLMDKWNVLKDSSQELFKSTITDSLHKNLEWLKPMNANQRTEYINQAPIMIAMAKNIKVDTPKGEINLYEGYDENGNWKSEYGKEPTESVLKYRLRLDQAIAKRIHGNYDPTSSPKLKRYIAGRAVIQFRSWLINAITTRFGNERYDDVLDINVKGRYRSIWETGAKRFDKVEKDEEGNIIKIVDKEGNTIKEFIPSVAKELMKSIIRQGSFNTLFKDSTFDSLSKRGDISDTDAANLRRVSMEMLLAIEVNLMLIVLTAALKGDDEDENYVYNTLFNQGLRLRTDLMLYVNPAEGRKLFKDIVPAITLIDNTKKWMFSAGDLMLGNDEYETGEYAGDSKFARNTAKVIPFATQGYRMYSSSVQEFN